MPSSKGDYLYSHHLLCGKCRPLPRRGSPPPALCTGPRARDAALLIDRNPKFLRWKSLCSAIGRHTMERDSLESARKALRAEALAHSARGAGEGADLGEELLRMCARRRGKKEKKKRPACAFTLAQERKHALAVSVQQRHVNGSWLRNKCERTRQFAALETRGAFSIGALCLESVSICISINLDLQRPGVLYLDLRPMAVFIVDGQSMSLNVRQQ